MTPVEFLRTVQPNGPWALGAIEPVDGADKDKAWDTVGTDEDAVSAFIRRKRKYNLYYSLNLVREDLGSRRARKGDIADCIAVHAEIDPPACTDLARWQGGKRRELSAWKRVDLPKPSVLVFSGSGFQMLWLLDEPTRDRAHVESTNRAIAKVLGGDTVSDVSRLFRLPGTLNYATEKKRNKYGRTAPVLAEVIDCAPQRRYSIREFSTDVGHEHGDAESVDPGPSVSREELRRLVRSPRLRRRIVNGHSRGEDRSDFVWHTAKELLACGVAPERVVAILIDPNFKISAHALAQVDPVRAASRAVARQGSHDEEAEGFDAAFEQAQEDIATALGTEEIAGRYTEPIFEPIEDLLARTYPPTPWRVEGLISDGGIAVIATEPKAAKTWLGTEVAMAVALGDRVCGEFTAQRCVVGYFYAEDHGASVQARWRSLAAGRGVELKDLAGQVHVQARGKYLDLTSDDDLAWVVASVRQRMGKIGLLVLDPLRDIHSGEEDKSDSMRDVMRRLRVLSDLLTCTVLIVHHKAKSSADSKGRRAGQSMRGSGAIHGSIDSGIYLTGLNVSDDRTRFTNTVTSEVKGARSAATFDLTLQIRDDEHGVAEHASWTVARDDASAADPKHEAKQEMILASLRAAGSALSANAIIKRDDRTWVTGTKAEALKAISRMVRDGTLRRLGKFGGRIVIDDGAMP